MSAILSGVGEVGEGVSLESGLGLEKAFSSDAIGVLAGETGEDYERLFVDVGVLC